MDYTLSEARSALQSKRLTLPQFAVLVRASSRFPQEHPMHIIHGQAIAAGEAYDQKHLTAREASMLIERTWHRCKNHAGRVGKFLIDREHYCMQCAVKELHRRG